jgi:hypothetical protein
MTGIEVMKQALDALVCLYEDGLDGFTAEAHRQTIITLRDAIEQADKQAKETCQDLATTTTQDAKVRRKPLKS